MNKGISITLLVVVVILSTGCGLQQQLDDLKRTSATQGQEIAVLQQQIAALMASIANNIVSINNLGQQADQLGNQYQQLLASIDAGDQTAAVDAAQLSDQIEALTIQEATLQLTLQTQEATLAQLQMNQTISSFVDPCGPSGGYDEVLMRTSNGTLIAYFEDGSGNRHLSLLTPGTYQTTDAQRCVFSVNSQGQVCDSTGCH